MRFAFFLVFLCISATVSQLAAFPAFVPRVLQPDVGMLMAMTVLAFARREEGLITVFAMGAQADLFGSARFGLLTVCYLIAAGLVLWAAWRELTRGDLLAPWIGGIAATALAHTLYVVLGMLCGLKVSWGPAMAAVVSLTLAACVWGLPISWFYGKLMYHFGLLSPGVRERWSVDARLAAARRGKVMRA